MQTNPHLSFTSSLHQQPSLSETLFLASVRDLFASRNLKVILKDKVKIFSAVAPCQFMLSTNYRPQNSGSIQRGKVKEKAGGGNVLATIQSPMELEETLSYESFKNKISLDIAVENVPWGTGLYWRGNEQDELIP